MSDFYIDKAMCECVGYVESEDEKFICAHLKNLECTFFTEPRCEYIIFYKNSKDKPIDVN